MEECKKNDCKDAVCQAAEKLANCSVSSSEKVTDPVILEERFNKIRSIGEECIAEEELRALLKNKPSFVAYDGFEPSGRMHIAQGIMKAFNVNKITSCGGTFIFWVADWFALLNNKMGGDLEKIKTVGRYMIEVWKAAGMNMENVRFLWASEEISKRADEYWALVFDIATKNSLTRVLRCTQIMGRSETDDLSAAQIFYPVMQCADIFFLKADICQLGMDQRKVNMLAREYCDSSKRRFKPIILSHHLIMGLAEGQAKMSKSSPDSAIYVEDSEADVNAKIKKAFCPPQQVELNPILEYIKFFIFEKWSSFTVKSAAGEKTYNSYEEVEREYASGAIHPGDLKPAVAAAINEMIRPIREHFQNDPEAKKILEKVKSYKVSR